MSLYICTAASLPACHHDMMGQIHKVIAWFLCQKNLEIAPETVLPIHREDRNLTSRKCAKGKVAAESDAINFNVFKMFFRAQSRPFQQMPHFHIHNEFALKFSCNLTAPAKTRCRFICLSVSGLTTTFSNNEVCVYQKHVMHTHIIHCKINIFIMVLLLRSKMLIVDKLWVNLHFKHPFIY